MSEWIGIDDRLPEVNRTVIILFADGSVVAGWHDGKEWLTDDDSFSMADSQVYITHWMTFPDIDGQGADNEQSDLKKVVHRLQMGALYIYPPDGIPLSQDECDILLTALGIEERLT